MGSRVETAPPAVVRKARVPAQPRAEPAKTTRVRKKSPLNGAGTNSASTINTGVQSSTTAPSLRPVPATSSAVDIDSLTSGMKKIKINLVTKEQREAKEQGKVPIKPATSRTTKPAAPRTTKAKAVPKASSGGVGGQPVVEASSTPFVDVTSQPPNPPSQPLNPLFDNVLQTAPQAQILPNPQPSIDFQQAAPFLPQHAVTSPLLVPSAFASPAVPQQPSPPPAGTPDVFISYQPEGPTPQPQLQYNGLQWLPPNTGTPSPMKRGDLPVFTSTGAIPFGVRPDFHAGPNSNNFEKQELSPSSLPADNVQMTSEEDAHFDIWEIPETPNKQPDIQ